MLSIVSIIFRLIFKLVVLVFSIYRFIIQQYRKYFHHHDQKIHDGKEASNGTIVWNRLIRSALKMNHVSVAKFREASRRQIALLYPNLEDSWFGCAKKVEKIEKLRDSYWITMKNCDENERFGKVMLFIHGGGFISGHPLGMDTQSVLYGLK